MKLFIVTTVPVTITGIMAGQPEALSSNFDVHIVSSPRPELNVIKKNVNLPVHSVAMSRGISPLKDLLSLIKMVYLLSKEKPDIIHSYTPKAGLISMLGGFICGVPIRVHTFTGLIFPTSKGFKKKILILMDRLICACATTIVPEGNGVRRDLVDYGITCKTLKVIGNGNIAGVDTSYFDKEKVIRSKTHLALIHQLSLPKDAFVFCFVGRFTQDKGFSELLTAFKNLPTNAHLLLVGEMDERLPLPCEITQTLNNHSRIHNIGWQDDIRPALALSDVLVLPSYREGFPNTPLQAGAMGLPCVVTDINGSNEIIESGYNGWIVPVKNSRALADAMLYSMNSNCLERLGVQSRNNIIKKFEQHNHWKNMIDFYNEQIKIPKKSNK